MKEADYIEAHKYSSNHRKDVGLMKTKKAQDKLHSVQNVVLILLLVQTQVFLQQLIFLKKCEGIGFNKIEDAPI